MGSFTKLNYHIVFGTKFRRNTIQSQFVERLYEYIGGTIRNRKGSLIEIGGVEDHLHLLVGLPPTITVSDAVRDIKANASKWINEERERNPGEKFEWQIGYGAFTVSYSHLETVQQYIRNQHEHHRVKTFEEEYIELLERHNVKFERRYLFEEEHTG
jgi:REP element-mobilizing transposase RayT